jgi:hypothetical protein
MRLAPKLNEGALCNISIQTLRVVGKGLKPRVVLPEAVLLERSYRKQLAPGVP